MVNLNICSHNLGVPSIASQHSKIIHRSYKIRDKRQRRSINEGIVFCTASTCQCSEKFTSSRHRRSSKGVVKLYFVSRRQRCLPSTLLIARVSDNKILITQIFAVNDWSYFSNWSSSLSIDSCQDNGEEHVSLCQCALNALKELNLAKKLPLIQELLTREKAVTLSQVKVFLG